MWPNPHSLKKSWIENFFFCAMILLSKWVTLPSYGTSIIIEIASFIYVKKRFIIARMLKESFIHFTSRNFKVTQFHVLVLRIFLQMTHVIVNFLLEVNNLLSWIVDEVTVAVKKVEIKDSTFRLLLSWHRYRIQYFALIKS